LALLGLFWQDWAVHLLIVFVGGKKFLTCVQVCAKSLQKVKSETWCDGENFDTKLQDSPFRLSLLRCYPA